MLRYITENQVSRNRRNLVESCFSEFTLHVIFLRKPKSTMRLQAHISSLPRRISSQKLCHVSLSTTFFFSIKHIRCTLNHQRCSLQFASGLGVWSAKLYQ